ncbi:HOG (high osmolarity glycerol) pathway protein [Allomyces arbusculus]|nr:HOG (high osmolarity glycerol) pathway protein [Allomyces arbusculus]
MSTATTTLTIAPTVPYKIRDFGWPTSSPLHWGNYPILSPTPSTTSDIDNLFPCHARALYDFEAQDESELSFTEGAALFILERRYPGWLVASLDDNEGLVPENYVCIEDMETASTTSSVSAASPPVSRRPSTAFSDKPMLSPLPSPRGSSAFSSSTFFNSDQRISLGPAAAFRRSGLRHSVRPPAIMTTASPTSVSEAGESEQAAEAAEPAPGDE